MIHEQDYIMRQVRMLTDFLVQIITKKKQGEYEDANELINTSIGEIYNLSKQEFAHLTLKETLSTCSEKAQHGEVILTTANILFEEIELLNEEQARHSSLQALLLYKKAVNSPNTAFPIDDIHKMNALQKKFEETPELAEINRILENNAS